MYKKAPTSSHMHVDAPAHTVHKHAHESASLRPPGTLASCDHCMPYNRGRPDQKADKEKNTRKEREKERISNKGGRVGPKEVQETEDLWGKKYLVSAFVTNNFDIQESVRLGRNFGLCHQTYTHKPPGHQVSTLQSNTKADLFIST